MLFLYHPQFLIAYSDRLEGYKPMPDGLVRVVGAQAEIATGLSQPKRCAA